MALQSSGAISISDIQTELGSSSGSLRTLSAAAGFSTPDSMSEFYGYSSVPTATDHFMPITYAGNGTSQTISTVGFQSDLIVLKAYQNSFTNYHFYDSQRGAIVGSYYFLYGDTSAQQAIYGSSRGLTGITSTGFSVNQNYHNASGTNYAAWCWKAGNSNVSNTDGANTSVVNVNQSAGFSTVRWTGTGSNANRTVGHGLSQAPEFVLIKNYSNTTNWVWWHAGFSGGTYYKKWDVGLAETNDSSVFSAAPTSSILNIGTNAMVNDLGDGIIAYCFHSVAGYSDFGTYTGNGSNTGPVVNIGFQPRMLFIMDRAGTFGPIQYDSATETSTSKTSPGDWSIHTLHGSNSIALDFLSNGFQPKTRYDINYSGQTYVYMAWA